MPSNNVETIRASHESWNNREMAACLKNTADNVVYTDNARGITMNGREQFRTWLESWAKGFSDGRISNPTYFDAGDTVIAQFTAVGTNDGSFGSLKPTGRQISLPFCEITRFDKQGRIISGSAYYDQYSMLVQLGLAQQQPVAA